MDIRQKRTKKEPMVTTFSFRCDYQLVQRIKAAANRLGVKPGRMVRDMLDRELK